MVRLKKMAWRLCRDLKINNRKLSFLFTTNAEIAGYHQRYFRKKTATDVITFADKKNIDIIISLDQARAQAAPRGLKLFHETVLLMCHGLLHAKGLNDLKEKERLKMRQREFECLIKLPF